MDETEKELKTALAKLETLYDKEWKEAGSPVTWCVNEPLFHSIERLKEAIASYLHCEPWEI